MYFALRIVLYVFAAAPVAALIATLYASNMKGGDGWAQGSAFVSLTVLLTPLIGLVFCVILLPKYKNQARFFLIEQVFVMLALVPMLGLGYFVTKELFTPQSGFRVFEAEKKIQEQREKKESDKDWKANERWSLAAPKCLSTQGEAIQNNCPGALRIKYCWNMPAGQDWGLRAHDCEKNEFQVITLQPGSQDKQERPWCRSYGGPCLAQFNPLLVEKRVVP
jgi:hypothetical protein